MDLPVTPPVKPMLAKAVPGIPEIGDLAFEPIMEAPLPVGFPAPVPAGEIAVIEYPRYRLARAGMKGGQNGTFFTLFRHIQSNDIPMTAPVEMTMDEDGTGMMSSPASARAPSST